MISKDQPALPSKTATKTEPLWTVEDVARYLRLEPDTVRGMARDAKLPAMKVGRVWRFRSDLIKAWVFEMASQPANETQPGEG